MCVYIPSLSIILPLSLARSILYSLRRLLFSPPCFTADPSPSFRPFYPSRATLAHLLRPCNPLLPFRASSSASPLAPRPCSARSSGLLLGLFALGSLADARAENPRRPPPAGGSFLLGCRKPDAFESTGRGYLSVQPLQRPATHLRVIRPRARSSNCVLVALSRARLATPRYHRQRVRAFVADAFADFLPSIHPSHRFSLSRYVASRGKISSSLRLFYLRSLSISWPENYYFATISVLLIAAPISIAISERHGIKRDDRRTRISVKVVLSATVPALPPQYLNCPINSWTFLSNGA